MSYKNKYNSAFSIIEIVVVLVVIAILATITSISYGNIASRANEAAVVDGLWNAATTLKEYKSVHGLYPTELNATTGCPTAPFADTNYCIRENSDLVTYDYVSDGYSFDIYAPYGTSGTFFQVTDTTEPEKITSGWRQVAGGEEHTCAIAYNNYAYCWGSNENGQLGTNTESWISLPNPTPIYRDGELAGLTVKEISSDNFHSCVIASDNNGYCWGNNNSGQIGDGASGIGNNRFVPTEVYRAGALNGLYLKKITTGGYSHSCAIASDNNAYCWGDNTNGAIGDGTSGSIKPFPTKVLNTGYLNDKTVKQISAGDDYTCAIASDNNAYCWGRNNYGQVGDNTYGTNRLEPTPVYRSGEINGMTIKSIAAGGYQACVVASDNNAYCWGNNYSGQIGNGSTGARVLVPTQVSNSGALNGKSISQISLGDAHSCAVTSDDNIFCWGDNDFGQIGNNSIYTDALLPVNIGQYGSINGKSIKKVNLGNFHTCAMDADDDLHCWGENNYGQLGNGTIGGFDGCIQTPTAVTSPF